MSLCDAALQAMPSSCRAGASGTAASSALLPRQMLASALLLVLLACSTSIKGAYCAPASDLSGNAELPPASPPQPWTPDLESLELQSVPGTYGGYPSPAPGQLPEPLVQPGTLDASDRPINPSVLPGRPVPGPGATATNSPSQQQLQATKSALQITKDSANTQGMGVLSEQLGQAFAEMTCQTWCTSRCQASGKQVPACIKPDGSQDSYRNDVDAEESNLRACDNVCRLVDREMSSPATAGTTGVAASTSGASMHTTAVSALLACGIAALASLAFL